MSTVKHLLPTGSSLLEKRAAECLQQAVQNQIEFANLINPRKCPVSFLPYLAWAFSVDYWEDYWGEEQKRQAIIDSYQNHSRKGTVGAVRRIVESLGYDFEIREWFTEKKQRRPGTFSVFVGLKEQGHDDKVYQELYRLIDDVKPVSRHINEITITFSSECHTHWFSAMHSGEVITIYPVERPITIQSQTHLLSAAHCGEIITINPR